MHRFIFVSLFIPILCFCQDSVDVFQLYQLALNNYPLRNQTLSYDKIAFDQQKVLGKQYMPQLQIQAQASWQSEVTSLPIKLPGIAVEELAADQYKVFLEGNQLIYDGGQIKNMKSLIRQQTEIEKKRNDIDFQKLKERIAQCFSQLLVTQGQMKLTDYIMSDLENSRRKISASVDGGVVLKTSLYQIDAEILKLQQKRTELNASREILLKQLSLLTKKEWSLTSVFKYNLPELGQVKQDNNRPEKELFRLQQDHMVMQKQMVNVKQRPRVLGFLQGGYGRPALNFLSNNFDPYFIGGLKAQWNISTFYTAKKEKSIWQWKQELLKCQEEIFDINQRIVMQQYMEEWKKNKDLMNIDLEIISLRQKIKEVTAAQLAEGTVTSVDYIRELNAEEQARQQYLIHEYQLLNSYLQFYNSTGQ